LGPQFSFFKIFKNKVYVHLLIRILVSIWKCCVARRLTNCCSVQTIYTRAAVYRHIVGQSKLVTQERIHIVHQSKLVTQERIHIVHQSKLLTQERIHIVHQSKLLTQERIHIVDQSKLVTQERIHIVDQSKLCTYARAPVEVATFSCDGRQDGDLETYLKQIASNRST
jgi:hypothetical protein